MDQHKQRILMKLFIIWSFSYSLLVWIFSSRNTKNRANKIFERALKLVYHDSPYLSFDELQIKDKPVSIYQRSHMFLATSVFYALPTGFTEDIFQFVN